MGRGIPSRWWGKLWSHEWRRHRNSDCKEMKNVPHWNPWTWVTFHSGSAAQELWGLVKFTFLSLGFWLGRHLGSKEGTHWEVTVLGMIEDPKRPCRSGWGSWTILAAVITSSTFEHLWHTRSFPLRLKEIQWLAQGLRAKTRIWTCDPYKLDHTLSSVSKAL